MNLKIKRLDKDLPLPKYESDGAAGIDVYASHDCKISTLEPTMVSTGIAVACDFGYEVQVRPRSGLAAKHGVTVVNSPGTIDCDYRGEVKVILQLLGIRHDHPLSTERTLEIKRGDRIAQLVVKPAPQVTITEVDELDDTKRGEDGFGSTGK